MKTAHGSDKLLTFDGDWNNFHACTVVNGKWYEHPVGIFYSAIDGLKSIFQTEGKYQAWILQSDYSTACNAPGPNPQPLILNDGTTIE